MTLNSVDHYGDYGYKYNKPTAIEFPIFIRSNYCSHHELIIPNRRALTVPCFTEGMGDAARVRSGKRVFGTVVLTGILVGATLGLIIGTSPQIRHISILNIVIFHPTPTSMALYGATAATTGLTVIVGIVLVLSRFDQPHA